MRAIFGFFPNRSVNDDYSFTVTLQDAKPYQYFSVLLSPCTSFKKVDMNFDACIENVAYRKKGDANWNDSALSKISLGEPTTTLKKGGDLVVGKPVTNDPNTLRFGRCQVQNMLKVRVTLCVQPLGTQARITSPP
jgi:hypothetical protein